MTYIKSESHAYLKELVERGAVKAVYHYALRETNKLEWTVHGRKEGAKCEIFLKKLYTNLITKQKETGNFEYLLNSF